MNVENALLRKGQKRRSDMTEFMRKRVLSGGENYKDDKVRPLASIEYEFSPASYFGKDTDFVKRTQLFDVWTWRRFVEQFRIGIVGV